MTRACLCLLACLLLPACADVEPINGCLLAAANYREALRARAYLAPSIPARLVFVRFAGARIGHALLLYRLTPEGWHAYDDSHGSRGLPLPNTAPFPDPLTAARLAFPEAPVVSAEWYDQPPR